MNILMAITNAFIGFILPLFRKKIVKSPTSISSLDKLHGA